MDSELLTFSLVLAPCLVILIVGVAVLLYRWLRHKSEQPSDEEETHVPAISPWVYQVPHPDTPMFTPFGTVVERPWADETPRCGDRRLGVSRPSRLCQVSDAEELGKELLFLMTLDVTALDDSVFGGSVPATPQPTAAAVAPVHGEVLVMSPQDAWKAVAQEVEIFHGLCATPL